MAVQWLLRYQSVVFNSLIIHRGCLPARDSVSEVDRGWVGTGGGMIVIVIVIESGVSFPCTCLIY